MSCLSSAIFPPIPICNLSGEVKGESIYLHRSSPLFENGLDKRENRHGRYGFASFPASPYLP